MITEGSLEHRLASELPNNIPLNGWCPTIRVDVWKEIENIHGHQLRNQTSGDTYALIKKQQKLLPPFGRQPGKLSPHSWHSDMAFPKFGMSNQIIRIHGIVQ